VPATAPSSSSSAAQNPSSTSAKPCSITSRRSASALQRAYREHGVGIEARGTPQVGPRFVRFEVRTTPGSRSDKLRQRTRDVQLRLELEREPMIVQDAGRLYIDIQRPDPQTVLFSTIVCVCDEYYALVSQQKDEKQEIEHAIGLLGAKGRAAGIHLILATQQPSRQTINGAISTNLPCRVALYLQNPIESRMISDQAGAERLTGAGDLLYKDFGNPVRLQAPYLPSEERTAVLR
jgi:DNA segregation ATPase FtsK/SpoIIIE-like protein